MSLIFLKNSREKGNTLLEVAISLWLIAIAAMGMLKLDLQMNRAQQSLNLELKATHLAEKMAEALRLNSLSNMIDFQKEAAELLPNGNILITQFKDSRLITVRWKNLKITDQNKKDLLFPELGCPNLFKDEEVSCVSFQSP